MIQSQYNQTARMALADAIVDAKARKNLSFEQLNEGTGLGLAFVVAALARYQEGRRPRRRLTRRDHPRRKIPSD